jgi:hypothetical protein
MGMGQHRRRMVAVLAVTVAIAATSLGATASSSGAATPGITWGAFTEPRNGLSPLDTFLSFEHEVGRQFMATRHYHALDNLGMDDSVSRLVADRGGIAYFGLQSEVNGTCVPWADVAAGKYDGYLHTIAAAAVAFGHPLFLSWNHEMVNNCNTGTPAQYVASWTHVRAVLQADGATNIRYVWAPTATMFKRGSAVAYEPPADQFDFVGVDGYNKSPAKWRTPDQVFGPAHAFAVAAGKPLFVGEVGCAEDPQNPTAKADWIASATQMFVGWGDVKAVIWSNTLSKANYWADTSPQSLAAFAGAGTLPAVQAAL